MTTSGSGLLVTGGTNSLKILVLVVSVASVAPSRNWAGWPKEIGRILITGRRSDLLAGLTPCWGGTACGPAACAGGCTARFDVDGAEGTGGADGTDGVDEGAKGAKAAAIG